MTDGEVGRIAEGLAELKGAVMVFMQNWKIQDERADVSRTEIHKKLNDTQIAVGGLTRDLAEVRNDIAELRVNREVQSTKNESRMTTLESAYQWSQGVVWGARLIGGAIILFVGWLLAHVLPLWH